MEDMISILAKCMKKYSKKHWSLEDIKHSLYINQGLDSIVFEITQPGRIPEVLEKMEKVSRISSETICGKQYWQIL
jgi:hypothetical protein